MRHIKFHVQFLAIRIRYYKNMLSTALSQGVELSLYLLFFVKTKRSSCETHGLLHLRRFFNNKKKKQKRYAYKHAEPYQWACALRKCFESFAQMPTLRPVPILLFLCHWKIAFKFILSKRLYFFIATYDQPIIVLFSDHVTTTIHVIVWVVCRSPNIS